MPSARPFQLQAEVCVELQDRPGLVCPRLPTKVALRALILASATEIVLHKRLRVNQKPFLPRQIVDHECGAGREVLVASQQPGQLLTFLHSQ